MALDLVTPFTKVQLEEEIKDTGRKQVLQAAREAGISKIGFVTETKAQ